MSTISTSSIGNGLNTNGYSTDIVVKDLDLDVSNRVKDDTPVLNMCMTKKRKVNSTAPLWTNDIYRLPAIQAWQEGAAVNSDNAENNQRYNLANYTQIFTTTIAATGTARAVMQSGGDPQSYQEVKQLIEMMFDVEQQLVRNDQVGTQYAGQAGTGDTTPQGASGTYWANTTPSKSGRRMGSLSSYAGTQSFNTTSGNVANISTWTNSTSSDVATESAGNLYINANGTQFYTGTFTNQAFSPITYKQLVTTAEQRYNAKVRTMVAPTSLRTNISDLIGTSNTNINRRNVERGDTIQTYEGDFNYTYEIFDSWIMDQSGVSNSIYFLNEEVLQWGSLRDLGPNQEVFSNADASLDQFIMEGCLVVRNPAGVAMLNQITTSNGSNSPSAPRPSALVKRAANTY
jgi:hypothetical protein